MLVTGKRLLGAQGHMGRVIVMAKYPVITALHLGWFSLLALTQFSQNFKIKLQIPSVSLL